MAKQKKKWMQDLKLKKGALKKELGVPAGKTIPGVKLEKATKSKNPTERKRAGLAETFKRIKNHL